MKKASLISFLFLILFSCSSEENKKEEIKNTTKKEYLIAYNIHIPDTTKDDWEIMLMDFDGSNKKNITNNTDVAWTYYGFNNRLFFISDRDTAYRHFYLYEMDTEGQNIRKISDLRLEDSWMSSRNNGEELIISGRIGKEIRYQLFLINTTTGKFTQLTNDTAAYHADPCFSPDGKQIVFSYQKNKGDKNSHEELYCMNADGSNMKQLTQYPEDNISAKEYGYKAGTPRWHPTENFISYVSYQDGRNHIFIIDPEGGKQKKLHETEFSESWHDWSPDGKWLVYNRTDSIGKQYHIILMNWETKELKQLTDTGYTSQLGPVFIEKIKP